MVAEREPGMLLEVELVGTTLSARLVPPAPPASGARDGLRAVIGGEREVDPELLRTLAADIGHLVHRGTRWGGDGDVGSRELLRRKGAALFDSLLPLPIKSELRRRGSGALEIVCGEAEAFIPWELLHTGVGFLGLDFAIGARAPSTARGDAPPPARRMLIVADPRGDLIGSYYEGLTLRDELSARARLAIDLRASDVGRSDVLELLREYDIVHYAGHAEPEEADGPRGWLLRDGALTAAAIAELAGGARFPRLVFVNACRSARREPDPRHGPSLAAALSDAGARHVIGTRWDVPDEPASGFALAFYAALFDGESVGEAARKARLAIAERYGVGSVYWASWTLIGPPDELCVTGRRRVGSRPAAAQPVVLGPLAARVRGEAATPEIVAVTTLEGGEPRWRATVRRALAAAILTALVALGAGLGARNRDGIEQSPVPSADFGPVERLQAAPWADQKASDELVLTLVGDDELAPGERFALRWGAAGAGFVSVCRVGSDGRVDLLVNGPVRGGESAIASGFSGDAIGTERFVIAWRAVPPADPRDFVAELEAETSAMTATGDERRMDLEVVRARVVEVLEDRFDRVRVLDVAHR